MTRETADASSQTPQHALYYTDALIENLQLRWGAGFLSPGGAEELAHMLGGLDVSGWRLLDFGCGIGGYDALLAEVHGAGHVIGVDIDAASLAKADAMRRERGLQDRLSFRQVHPGPLPFDAHSFDMVFSKDSIIDSPDKDAILRELFRLCKPGGLIVLGDWFCSDRPYTEEMREWATTGDETYQMQSLSDAARLVEAAGFSDIETVDRNAWFRSYARDEHERLKGPLYETYVEKFGEDQARKSVENARIRSLLADQGQLRPGHVRGRKAK